MSITRKSTNKYIINECYKPSEEFPAGRLPILKQVIERCLFFKDYKTSDVQGTVSKELFDLWVACNVYPISIHAIKNKLNVQVKEFSRLLNYDKKKRHLAKYQTDAQKFIEDGSNLFDIFQTDPKLLAKTEKAYLLKMLDEDYRFYEDQKTTRQGYCTTKNVHETLSEKRFKERSIQKNISERKDITPDYLKPGCSSQELEDGSSQESEEETQKTPKRKCIQNNCEDPDFYEDGSGDAQNRRELKMLAEICDRYQIPESWCGNCFCYIGRFWHPNQRKYAKCDWQLFLVMNPLIKQSGGLYRRMYVYTRQMKLINIQTLSTICTIKSSNASEMLLINIKKDLKKNDALLLGESVNTTLTPNFLDLQRPLLLCNPPESSITLLKEKYPSAMKHLTLADFDLSHISKVFWLTKFNKNMERSLVILNSLKSFSPPSLNLKFVTVTDSYKFLYNIGLMYIYQELIYDDYLNPTFYLYMPPIVYSSQPKFLPISWPLKLGVFLKNFFDITFLGSQPLKSFSLTRKYHSLAKKLTREPELHLIRLIPKDINKLKKVTSGNLITFQFFIDYLIRQPKYASLITSLEEFMPECAEELIQEGFQMTDFPSTLSVEQWRKAFQVFIRCPNFSNSSFLEEFKSYHSYHENKGFFLDYPDELLKDNLSEYFDYEDSVAVESPDIHE